MSSQGTQWAAPGKVPVRCLGSGQRSACRRKVGCPPAPKPAPWKQDQSADSCAGLCGSPGPRPWPPLGDLHQSSRTGSPGNPGASPAEEGGGRWSPALAPATRGLQTRGGWGSESLWHPRGRLLLSEQPGRLAEAWGTGKGRLDRGGEGPPPPAS